MLGKGLESLIPKKDGQAQNQDADFLKPQISNQQSTNQPAQISIEEKGEEDFSSPKPAQASGHGVPSEARDERAEEQASSPRRGERSGLREEKSSSKDAIFHIEIEKIKSNPLQPRKEFDEEALKELAASIREYGILQPIVVSKIENDEEYGTKIEYQLIAGERRLMAAKLLGWERIPAIVRHVENKVNHLELAIIENLQRENLNPVETARAYAKLQDEFGLTQREVAARMGKSRETVANSMRLLDLPGAIQDAIAKGQVNESQARFLLTITDQAQQQKLFEEILDKNLSVKELKAKVSGKAQSANRESQHTNDPEILSLQEKLTELLGAKVKIEKGQKEGKIIISFYSPEEIQGIVDKLT